MKFRFRAWILPIIALAFLLGPMLSSVRAAEIQDWVEGGFWKCKYEARSGRVCKEAYASSLRKDVLCDFNYRAGPVIDSVCFNEAELTRLDPEYVREVKGSTVYAHVSNAIVAMYSNPPSTTAWAFRDLGQTFAIIPKSVNAQGGPGIGFSGLTPILPIWRATRNIAYLLLAMVMIVVGFMIMLRKKIDPKTVVTIQSALPRIVLSLILITFSYAIVGIMIDLMYLAIMIALAVMSTSGMLPPAPEGIFASAYPSNAALYTNGGLWSMVHSVFPVDPGKADFGLFDFAYSMMGSKAVAAQTAIGAVIGTIMMPGVGTVAGAGLGATAVPALMVALLSLALLFTVIRLFILFLNSYIQIILAVIIGPFQLLMEAVPGASGFSGWIKNLLANLSVFPVAGIMFMLAAAFGRAAEQYGGAIWTPPYLSVSTSVKSISAMFSLGVIMAIPTVCKSIAEGLKAKSPINAGPGAIFAPIGGAFSTGTSVMSSYYYAHPLMDAIGGFLGRGKGDHKKEG
jgi:hypothetical protein